MLLRASPPLSLFFTSLGGGCPDRRLGSSGSCLVYVCDEFRWFPARSPVPLSSGYVAVTVSLGNGCPYRRS